MAMAFRRFYVSCIANAKGFEAKVFGELHIADNTISLLLPVL